MQKRENTRSTGHPTRAARAARAPTAPSRSLSATAGSPAVLARLPRARYRQPRRLERVRPVLDRERLPATNPRISRQRVERSSRRRRHVTADVRMTATCSGAAPAGAKQRARRAPARARRGRPCAARPASRRPASCAAIARSASSSARGHPRPRSRPSCPRRSVRAPRCRRLDPSARLAQPRRVRGVKSAPSSFERRASSRIARRAGHVRDDRAVLAHQTVHEGDDLPAFGWPTITTGTPSRIAANTPHRWCDAALSRSRRCADQFRGHFDAADVLGEVRARLDSRRRVGERLSCARSSHAELAAMARAPRVACSRSARRSAPRPPRPARGRAGRAGTRAA